jgi:hypothetical protein
VIAHELATLARRAVGDGEARAALWGAARRLPTALHERRPVSRQVEHELRLLADDVPPIHPVG